MNHRPAVTMFALCALALTPATCTQPFTVVAPSSRPPLPDPGSSTNVWDFEGPGSGLDDWDVLQPTELRNGQTRVVEPADHGVPARPGGTNADVLRATVNNRQRAAGAYAAYLYKVWAVAAPETGWRSASGKPLERIRRGEEGGTYRAWYFLPRSTRRVLRHNNHGRHGWVNIFQFKHSNPDGGGPGHWAQPPPVVGQHPQ